MLKIKSGKKSNKGFAIAERNTYVKFSIKRGKIRTINHLKVGKYLFAIHKIYQIGKLNTGSNTAS